MLEIHGGGFINKGAELMVRTAASELAGRLPGAKLAVYPLDAAYATTAHLGLYHILPGAGRVGRFARPAARLQALAPASIRAKLAGLKETYGLVGDAGLDGLVDVSGFAFSDVWGPDPAASFAALSAAYRRRGKPVVLLPQAFGPFTNPRIRDAFRTIVMNSTLVFARDAVSHSLAVKATEQPDRVLRAPDITLFSGLPLDYDSGLGAESTFACLVPNSRMLDQSGSRRSDWYARAMIAAGRLAQDAGFEVRIVVHSDEVGDARLAHEISGGLRVSRSAVVPAGDAFALKALIGRAACVIGSRYHSLVSALAQGVPSVAFGWAHKYGGLFADFGVPELCLDSTSSEAEIDAAVHRVLEPSSAAKLREILGLRLHDLALENEAMWGLAVDAFRTQS